MPTKPYIERALRSRVRGLVRVQITNGRSPVVLVEPGTAEVINNVQRALEHLRSMGTHFEVQAFKTPPLEPAISVQARFRFAALAPALTTDGVIETTRKLVPSLECIKVESGYPIVVRVGNEDGLCPDDLRSEVTAAMTTCVAHGVPFEVRPLTDTERKNYRRNRKRDPRVEEFTEQDEESFARRIGQLLSGSRDEVPLIDAAGGTKIMTTLNRGNAPIGCFLPTYDRVFVTLVPTRSNSEDYFQSEFDMDEETFLSYCRLEKVVPVFKFALSAYPEAVYRRFLEDPSLPFVTGRELDYVTARHTWETQQWVRKLREDSEVSQALFEVLELVAESGATGPESRFFRGFLEDFLSSAESFEGIFWRKGHLAAGQFGPAMALTKMIDAMTPHNSMSMAPIEAYGAAMHFAMARSLGASLAEGLISPGILELVAEAYGAAPDESVAAPRVARMTEIIGGLQLEFNSEISPEEYVEILNLENTRRLRAIVAGILATGDEDGERELRELVQKYNKGVREIGRRAVGEVANISILGDAAEVAGKAAGLGWFAKLLKLDTIQQSVVMLGSKLDDRIGDPLDRCRGWLNDVPSESIRLYKIRRQLEKASRKTM